MSNRGIREEDCSGSNRRKRWKRVGGGGREGAAKGTREEWWDSRGRGG